MSAKAAKDTIYVDVDDEITGIIDKVENAEHKVIALVLPKRATSLQSIVNMKLLKRSADSSGKNVVLITSEAALLPLAGAAGLHVAKNLQSAPEIPEAPHGSIAKAAPAAEEVAEADEAGEEDLPGKFDYDRPVGALAAKHEADNPETIDLDDEDETKPAAAAAAAGAAKAAKNKLKVPNFDRFRLMLGLAALGLVALIVFIFLAIFVLPKATITIHTTSEPVSANFNLTASTGTSALDPAGSAIPAKLEIKDQTATQQVTATGQQNNGQKATGSVTMTICANSPGQVNNVPSGTGVSSSGLSYITQQSANFSFAGSCSGGTFKFQSNSVSITAVQPGSKYNSSISGASVSGSSATADGSASGGSDNIITVLSQSDVDGVKNKLTSDTTTASFTKDFESTLTSQGEYVLGSTLKASDPVITASPSVGQPASTANVSVKITYTVLTVKKSDLSSAIQFKLASQIDKSKQKLSDNYFNDANITVQSQPSANSAILAINEDTTAVPIIDIAQVKKVAAGNKVGDIKSAIGSWAGVKSVDVNLSPFWVSKVPSKDSKIKVILVEVKDSSSNSAP